MVIYKHHEHSAKQENKNLFLYYHVKTDGYMIVVNKTFIYCGYLGIYVVYGCILKYPNR